MKLTVFQFEGTPEELDASQALRELTKSQYATLVSVAGATDTARENSSSGIPGVPEEGQSDVRKLVGLSPAPKLFVHFMSVTAEWDSVIVRGIKRKGSQAGAPLDYSRYLRLRKQGSSKGGFAYVFPEFSRINFRLAYTDQQLTDLDITTARTATTGYPEYRVTIDLQNDTEEQSLTDALMLAKLAYDGT